MLNIHELIDNIELQLSNKKVLELWFSSLDLLNPFRQLKLCNNTSNQCNFGFVRGKITGTYHFFTGFYGKGDSAKRNSTSNGFPFKEYTSYKFLL